MLAVMRIPIGAMPVGMGVNAKPVRVGYRPVISIARETAQVAAPE